MREKRLIRKYLLNKRKKKYFKISDAFFSPLIHLIKKTKKNKKIKIAIYIPGSFEVDVLKILNIEYFKKFTFLLPVIGEHNSMNFYKWKKNDILYVNRLGILEPFKSKISIPNLILVPLLAFDKKKNRLGYGKGFYDKFLNRYNKVGNKILTVGVAFSFQKYNNLPVNTKDYKLDYVMTEKGII